MNIVISDIVKDLIINIINIIVLFIIVRSLAYKPVKKFLDARTEKIEKMKQDAENANAQAKASEEKYEKLIEQSKNESVEIIHEAERTAKENAAGIIENAKKSAADITAKARANTVKEHDNMISSMKEDITGLAFDISKRVLSREISDDDNKKIADEFFAQQETK